MGNIKMNEQATIQLGNKDFEYMTWGPNAELFIEKTKESFIANGFQELEQRNNPDFLYTSAALHPEGIG